MSWQWAAATVHPFPHSSVGRKLEQCVYACVFDTVAALCVCVCVCVCMCEREDERSHSYYIKQDFPEQSAPATELPKSSSGFPPQHKLCGRAESRLFVLEHHCSGAAEAMSQHRRHSAHLPRIAQLLNLWLLLCHLAFPDGIYRSKNHSLTPIIDGGNLLTVKLSFFFFSFTRYCGNPAVLTDAASPWCMTHSWALLARRLRGLIYLCPNKYCFV